MDADRILRRSERGATLLELLTVVAIIGTIANIAVPGSLMALERARAAAVVADFVKVREAAFRRYADLGAYPQGGEIGVVPAEMEGYLDSNFRWTRSKPAIRFEWACWIGSNGEPLRPSTGVQVGLSIIAGERNPKLFDNIERIYDGQFVRISTNRAMFVIEPIPE